MDELAAWLRAQLDVDEQVARVAPRGPWVMDGSGSITDADGARVVPSVGGALDGRVTRWPEGPSADHILGHDPARVLREIDAKRGLVKQIFRYEAKIDGEWGCCHDAEEIEAGECEETPPNEIEALRVLALPYADRPGYRTEWRP